MKKRLLALLLTLTTGLGLTACGSAGSAKTEGSASDSTASGELTTVRSAVMTNGAMHWISVIGDESGIFEEHGIQLEITEFAAGINTVDAIVTEQADIGNLADYAAVNRLGNTQDNNLCIISRISTGHDGALYVDSSRIQALEDLAGQPFATQVGTVWDYWNAKAYEAGGVAEEDQNIVSVDSAASAVTLMTTGQAAAFWANGANATKLDEAGLDKLTTLEDMGLTVDAYYIASTSFLEENPEVVEEYLKASQETIDWIYENKDEAAEIIEKRLGTTQDQFLSDLEATDLTIDYPQTTLDHLNDIKGWAVGNGSFEDYDLADFTDLSALKNALPDADIID